MQTNIFFYDSSCGVCSQFIRRLHRKDRSCQIYFAPIGGVTYDQFKTFFPRASEIDSSLFYAKGKGYVEAEAIFQSLAETSGLERFIGRMLILLPLPLTRSAYQLFAKHRHLFSRVIAKDACSLPPASLKAQFLK